MLTTLKTFLTGRFREFLQPFGYDPAAERRARPEELAAFQAHAKRLTSGILLATSGVLILLTAGVFPTDFILFEIGSRAFRTLFAWRLVVVGTCAALFAALYFDTWFKDHPYFAGLTCLSIGVGASGYMTGSFGGIETPLFYGIYSIPLLTILLIVPLGQRIAATIWIMLVFAACFFIPFPRHLNHPLIGVPAVWLFCLAWGFVAVGHVVYYLLRANFLQRLSLDRRVAEQTAEIRELAAHLISTQERERRRIGHDIHDDFGQILTGLRMELERLELIAGRPAPDVKRLAESVATARGLLAALHAALDGILGALRPLAREGGAGLVESIERLTRGVQSRQGIQCDFQLKAVLDDLNPEAATALFRIVQESLTNVTRHSGARRVSIEMNRHDDLLQLTIADDGRGFQAQAVQAGSRFGLSGIEERTRWLGGTCKIVSAPERGTTIAVTIPYAANARQEQL